MLINTNTYTYIIRHNLKNMEVIIDRFLTHSPANSVDAVLIMCAYINTIDASKPMGLINHLVLNPNIRR